MKQSLFLSGYLWVVRPLLQNSMKVKKLDGGSTVRKSPIGEI